MTVIRNYPNVNYPQLIVKTYAVQPPELANAPEKPLAKNMILWVAIALVLYVIASAIFLPELRPQSLLYAGQLWVSLWQAMFQSAQVVMHHYLLAIL